MEAKEGTCYLLEEPQLGLAYRLLGLQHDRGSPCLLVSRLPADQATRRHGVSGIPTVWLCDIPGEGNQSPKAIAGLARRIEAFIEGAHGRGTVLLDGLEYLVLTNGFEAVMAFVEHLNEFIMARKALLLIPVNPKALEPRQLALLERDLAVPDVDAWMSEMDMRRWSEMIDRGA